MRTIKEASRHYAENKTEIGMGYILSAKFAFEAGAEFAQSWIDPEAELPKTGETFLAKLSKPRDYDGHGESIYQLNIRTSKNDKECLSFLKAQGVIGWRRIEIE